MMRRFVPPLLAMPLLIAAAPTAQPPGKGCLNSAVTPAAGADGNGFRRLDQLPPANEVLTVIKLEDGCMKPVIVRYGVDKAPPLGR